MGEDDLKLDTAILITTFLRDELLFRCIKSVRQFYPNMPIFIGDNGEPDPLKTRFCQEHKCKLFALPFDLGVGGTRNESIKQIPKKYKYIVIIEDDIIFTEGTKLEYWREILDSNSKIGIVGGLLKPNETREQHYEATTWIADETHYIEKVISDYQKWKKTKNTQYFLCDLILNVFMMRRSTWEDTKWDPQFKTALEHSDFFLRLKYKADENGRPKFDKKFQPILRPDPIKIAYTPNVWMYHKHDVASGIRYQKYRTRPIGWILFGRKWLVKYSRSTWNKTNPVNLNLMKSSYNIQDENLELAIRIFEKHKCKWWLEAGTCLGVVPSTSGFQQNT